MDLNVAVKNIKAHAGVTTNKELAAIFGLTPADFSNRKQRGTLLFQIVDYCQQHRLSIDDILRSQTWTAGWATPDHKLDQHTRQVIMDVIEGVESYLDKHDLCMAGDKRAALVVYLIDRYLSTDGPPTTDELAAIIKLTA